MSETSLMRICIKSSVTSALALSYLVVDREMIGAFMTL
jgi:hypothetical protein